MIRRLLATTAIVTIAATGAYAAETPAKTDAQAMERFHANADNTVLASQLIGETVYASAAEDAETIGEVEDLVMNDSGDIDAAVVAVGGFLGIGEKYVAVNLDNLKLTAEEDGTQYVVLETSKEELEAAPEFDLQAAKDATTRDQAAMAPDEQSRDSERMASAEGEMEKKQEMAAADPEATNPAAPTGAAVSMTPTRDSLNEADVSTIGSDDVIGTTVYSNNDENVGEVGEVVLTDDGEIEAVIIDVGGFLGIGEKPVAVAFSDLEFRADENGTLYIYTRFTEDELEAAAAYDEDSYKENRDSMLMKTSG